MDVFADDVTPSMTSTSLLNGPETINRDISSHSASSSDKIFDWVTCAICTLRFLDSV